MTLERPMLPPRADERQVIQFSAALWTRDHIRPRSKGGTLASGNKALACAPCNTDKGSRTLGSWL